MLRILVANPKGGCGKSTIATNLAVWLAWQGEPVMLGDLDRLQSSRRWLAQRPAQLPVIQGWDIKVDEPARPPKGTTAVVLDSPAGLHGKKLDAVLKTVDRVIVPVQPSQFDLWAMEDFLARLAEEKAVRKGRIHIGLVSNRVDGRTQSAKGLETHLENLGLPLIARLRDTQAYIQLLPRGLGVFDLPAARTQKDRDQWQPLVNWIQDSPA